MTVAAYEFIRRFLLHVLADGFHRIRHYGFLANGGCSDHLARCRQLLDARVTAVAPESTIGGIILRRVYPSAHRHLCWCPSSRRRWGMAAASGGCDQLREIDCLFIRALR